MIAGVPISNIGPQYFIKNFPKLKAEIENCCGVKEPAKDIREVFVKDFFLDFGRSIDPEILWKLKVSKLE